MPILKNSKHELFAQGVVKGLTADAAFVAAGYAANASNAGRLIRNEQVRARITEIKEQLAANTIQAAQFTGLTEARVLEELGYIALADPTDIAEWGEAIPTMIPDMDEAVFIQGVRLKPSADLPRSVRAAISEIRQTKDGLVVKFHSKTKALELIGRNLGIWKDKVEVSADMTLEAMVLEAMRRRAEREAARSATLDAPKLIEGETVRLTE